MRDRDRSPRVQFLNKLALTAVVLCRLRRSRRRLLPMDGGYNVSGSRFDLRSSAGESTAGPLLKERQHGSWCNKKARKKSEAVCCSGRDRAPHFTGSAAQWFRNTPSSPQNDRRHRTLVWPRSAKQVSNLQSGGEHGGNASGKTSLARRQKRSMCTSTGFDSLCEQPVMRSTKPVNWRCCGSSSVTLQLTPTLAERYRHDYQKSSVLSMIGATKNQRCG